MMNKITLKTNESRIFEESQGFEQMMVYPDEPVEFSVNFDPGTGQFYSNSTMHTTTHITIIEKSHKYSTPANSRVAIPKTKQERVKIEVIKGNFSGYITFT